MKTPLLLVSLITAAVAQDTPPATTAPPATPPATTNEPPKSGRAKLLAYKPPKTGNNVERKDGDGASRAQITLPSGAQITLPNLYVLTPKQGAALTTQAQPSLFTFQTAMCPVEYRVTITRPNQPEPAFIYAVSRTAPGFHRVNLAEFDVTLQPNVQYTWTVLLRPDPNGGAKDLEAHGTITRINPDAALAQKIKTATPDELPAVYAEAGIWYDTLAALSDRIQANSGDKDFLALRADLLKQVDLEAAATDKRTETKITLPKGAKSPQASVGAASTGRLEN